MFNDLGSNSDFIILLVIFSTLIGVSQTFGSLVGSLFAPFGLSAGQISFYGLLILSSGILVAPIVGSVVGRCKMYLLSLRTLLFTLALTFAGSLAFVQSIDDYKSAFAVSMVVVGACGVSLVPICIDFAIETSFPVQPHIVNGIMAMAG